jgi:uncharacterized membrane-anchored protein
MFHKSVFATIFCWVFGITIVWGAVPDQEKASSPEFKGSLNFRKGEIALANGMAKLHVPENFRYLGPEDAERVMVNTWGNYGDDRILGMLLPAGVMPTAKDAWGVVITYVEDGHVSDEDADDIDYKNILVEMRNGIAKEIKQWSRTGHERIDLIGWAVRPRYDKENHTLFSASELSFGGSSEHTLNYNIHIFGRNGVLSLNAVADMDQLADIEKSIPDVSALIEFNPGHRYEDFNITTDRLATYGFAELVSGGLTSKNGFFYRLLAMLSSGRIILFMLLSVLGGFLIHIFRKKQADLPSS